LRSKPDFDECMARIYAWYEQKVIDRAPVRFHHHNVEYERSRVVEGPWESVEDRWSDVEFQVKTFTDSLEGVELAGETFPVFWPNLSAVVYNMFLGQTAEFDDVTAWAHPCIEDLGSLPELRVERDGRCFRTVEALTGRALECAEGRFMVGYTDMYAGIDCTAGLRGAEKMCLDFVMDPDGIRGLIERAYSEYPGVYDHFNQMLKKHGQLSVTWKNLPSFETFNVLACDFAVNISPGHFDGFCMPILRKEAGLFTQNVFHMDGPGVARNIDSILALPNLVGDQWVQGYGKDRPIMQWVPLVEKIQAAGKSVIVDLQLDELDEFMGKIAPEGVMLWIPAGPDVQQDVLEKVKGWSGPSVERRGQAAGRRGRPGRLCSPAPCG
jgi:hypothetical protein